MTPYPRELKIFGYSFVFLLLLTHCTPKQECAQKKPDEDYLPGLLCASDFSLLQGAPLSTQYAQVEAVKLVYDLQTQQLYFINNDKYRFHFDFCSRYLSFPKDLTQFNNSEYGHSASRRFLLANLNFYKTSDLYTLEFFSDDQITPPQIALLFACVERSVYFRKKLFLLSNANSEC